MVQVLTVDAGNLGDRVLAVLADRDFIISNMPFVVGVENDKVTLQFSRFLFSFKDTYSISVEGGPAERSLRLMLRGRRSTIVVEYVLRDNTIEVNVGYRGPRGWVVDRRLSELANTLLSAAIRVARERRGPVVGDLSSKLATISWTSRLLMKSMLLKNELVMIPKGGLMSYIENLISGKILQQYPVVYVSGNAENGSFRLIFVNGELKGVYVVVNGKEFVGDEKALNMIEGITRVKVYASLGKPEEVLSP